eukprot:2460563-Prymnesium_polylepis.1
MSSSGSVYMSWSALLQPVSSSLELTTMGCPPVALSTVPYRWRTSAPASSAQQPAELRATQLSQKPRSTQPERMRERSNGRITCSAHHGSVASTKPSGLSSSSITPASRKTMSPGTKTNLSRVNEASSVCCGARARAAAVPSRTRASAWSKLTTRPPAPRLAAAQSGRSRNAPCSWRRARC